MLAKIITKIPNPTEAHLDLLAPIIPLITLSIPTIRNIIARIITKVTNVMPGNTIAYMARIMANTPSPICTARFQVGDFTEVSVIL